MSLFQLTYISSVTPGSDPDVNQILATSRRNNDRDGLSGLLISDGKRFLQALEGEKEAISRTFDRIKADPRHRAVVTLSSREIAERQFGQWAMAWNRVSTADSGRTLADVVDLLTAEVGDANTQALFRGFARVERKFAA